MSGSTGSRIYRVSELPGLLDSVTDARTQLAQERGSKSAFHPQTIAARLDLLTALELYASALTSTGRPLPYRLRDELFLYRRLRGSRGG